VLRLALPAASSAALPAPAPDFPVIAPQGGWSACWEASAWLEAAQAALRRAAECDNPDQARILVSYTNRSLEQLVAPGPSAPSMAPMADQLPVLPAKCAPRPGGRLDTALPQGEEGAREPDMVLALESGAGGARCHSGAL